MAQLDSETRIRQTAIKTNVSRILGGKYVVNEGWEPNYILYGDQKLSRVSIIGVVVSKNQDAFSNNSSIMIDDGTGRISVRAFEENLFINGASVGEIVLLVGRPREYSNEIYIVPEIIKKIDDRRWVEVRKLEIGEDAVLPSVAYPDHVEQKTPSIIPKAAENPHIIKETEDNEEDETTSEEEKAEVSSLDGILKLIKGIDKGDGADFDEVVRLSKKSNAEEIINNLLKNGDLFELRPGKLKVLE